MILLWFAVNDQIKQPIKHHGKYLQWPLKKQILATLCTQVMNETLLSNLLLSNESNKWYAIYFILKITCSTVLIKVITKQDMSESGWLISTAISWGIPRLAGIIKNAKCRCFNLIFTKPKSLIFCNTKKIIWCCLSICPVFNCSKTLLEREVLSTPRAAWRNLIMPTR